MEDTATRRQILRAGAVTAAGVVGGCSGTSDGPSDATPEPTAMPTTTGTYASTPRGPSEYPDRPDEATTDAALTFAKAFERTRAYNMLHEQDVEEISVQGAAKSDRPAYGGHYVLATASGYANYADDLHADWGQLPALYFVSPDLVVRAGDYRDKYFDCSEVFASETSGENFATPCDGQWASYRVHNLHTELHELSVSVVYDPEGASTPVLEREYNVESTGGIQQESVTYRRGTYRVTAETPEGLSASRDWHLGGPPDQDRPLTVLVTPAGSLRIRRVPFGSVR